MKRTKETKNDKSGYILSLSESYEVEFIKDGYRFKNGDTTYVTLPIALKLINEGKVRETDKIQMIVSDKNMDSLLTKGKKNKK